MLFRTGIIFLLSLCFSSRELIAGDLYNSVTEFGAKGNGVTDDTDAIQKAINASNASVISSNNIPGVYNGPIYFGNAKTVYFPAGIYKISRPITVTSYISMLGDKAILCPSAKFKPGSVGIIGKDTWQGHISGLQLISFDKALHLENNNIDCGKINIENCEFLSNQVAVTIKAQSSYVLICNNRFVDNQKAVIIEAGQKTDMSNNWITAGRLKGKHDAQIITYGVLHFDKNVLVPVNPEAGTVEPAWINNYSSVIINGTRQGGESGSFTLVNNFAAAAVKEPIWPNAVIIKDCECYAVYGNTRDYIQPAALRLINVPNNIVLENLVGFINAKVLDYSAASGAGKPAKRGNKPNDKNLIKIKLNNIQGGISKHANGTDLPEGLVEYLEK